MSVSKVIAKAWTDPDFKARFVSDPRSALSEHGIEVPEGASVNVLEDTADTVHLVLPVAPPDAGDLSMDTLEEVAAGLPAETYTCVASVCG